MAATKPASSITSLSFNFLKEGLLLPVRNRRLFAAIFAILVAWISLLLVANELGIEPLKLEVGRDMDTLMSTDPRGPDYAHLLRETQEGVPGAVYLVSADITGSFIQLVSLSAAVTTYSGAGGEVVHNFGVLLGRAKQQLKGAVLMVAFVCTLKTAAVALLLASSAALVAFLAFWPRYHYHGLLLAGCLVVLLVAFVFYIFLSFFCSLAVIVALDESAAAARHRHGAGAAVRRAWQLVKGRRRRAMLFVSVMSVLAAILRPIYWQAKICARSDMASGALLLGVLYAVQMAAVELFQDCALTAFYYGCKGRSVQESEKEYVKLSIQDA
ncbi:hypothetical protein SORBI_3005G144900 [Sorghum bicolor]|uniref:Uncharacterized protein n=1 Tax=Sorghum bicolor TaxID=4558 RepID=A0A1Z5RJ87_SORBI|nr:hypothetical protein SORBI_3005G144900 [Sorghum bicolor]